MPLNYKKRDFWKPNEKSTNRRLQTFRQEKKEKKKQQQQKNIDTPRRLKTCENETSRLIKKASEWEQLLYSIIEAKQTV